MTPDIDDDGVDRAQIRAMLALTPEERLKRVEEFLESALEVRELNHARPFTEILRVLVENEVEFIVVGMTAGILQGAPVTTLDLDVVHRRSPENVARRLRVLAGLDAVYRHDPRKLRPQESHLLGPGHQLLAGKTVRVLSLPALIEAKERAGRPKDLAVLPSCARLSMS
jgi:hypothetical protein